MSNLTKVSMNLTDKDIENTTRLKNLLHARNNATAVSVALAMASSLSEHLANGENLYIETKDGKTMRVIFPGI